MQNHAVFKIFKKNREKIALIIILFLALILRTTRLSSVPAGFFSDEASIAYNAFSLLQTGKDEFGVPFPIFFQSFGDYRPPLSVYSALPFVGIFGLNETAARLPSVFYGILTLLGLYLIGKELISKKFGLVCAIIGTTMPWLIHYNRTGFEFTIYCAFFVITVYLFLKAVKKKSFIIPAFISAGLTLYTYQPARLMIPLFLFGIIIIYWKKLLTHKKEVIVGTYIFLLFCIPFILSFVNGTAVARFNMVSVFSANLSFVGLVKKILLNYFYQLSPSLLLAGDPTRISRHFTGGLLPVLQITVPFIYLGIMYAINMFKKKSMQLLLFWLLIYPVAGAVVADPPFTSRSIIGAPLFVIFIGLGIYWVLKSIKKNAVKKTVVITISAAIFLNTLIFVNFYFTKYPQYSSGFWGWQYGPKEIVAYFAAHQNSYDDLAISNDFNAPYIFFRFYAPYDCQKCKVGYPNDLYNPTRKQLFVVTPDYMRYFYRYNWKPIKTIYYPNKQPAFILTEIKK